MRVKTLHLTLKWQWFKAIMAGTKTEEFRDVGGYWDRILGPHVDKDLPWREVHFRNGYQSTSPWMRVGILGLRRGPHNGRECYILSLGPVLETRHLPTKRP